MKGVSEEAFEFLMKQSIKNDVALDKKIDAAKKQLFIDLWNSECSYGSNKDHFGKYNEETGYFELNGITDITYEEALRIWNRSYIRKTASATGTAKYLFGHCSGWIEYKEYLDCRTYFPILASTGYSQPDLSYSFYYNEKVEVAAYIGGYSSRWGGVNGNFIAAFSNCKNLRKIIGRIEFPKVNSETFKNCVKLQDIQLCLDIGAYEVDFSDSPLLSYESVLYMATNRRVLANTEFKNATIILHVDVYDKMVNADSPDYEKWHPLIELATKSNIQFASSNLNGE